MNVLLVDDHNLFRDGLAHLLQGLADTLTFFHAKAVTDELERLGPIDLVLLDMHMPGLEGTDAVAATRTRLIDPGATLGAHASSAPWRNSATLSSAASMVNES